jgi:hypothetical protein
MPPFIIGVDENDRQGAAALRSLLHTRFNAHRVMNHIAGEAAIGFPRLHIPAGVSRAGLQDACAFLLRHLPSVLPAPPEKPLRRIEKPLPRATTLRVPATRMLQIPRYAPPSTRIVCPVI